MSRCSNNKSQSLSIQHVINKNKHGIKDYIMYLYIKYKYIYNYKSGLLFYLYACLEVSIYFITIFPYFSISYVYFTYFIVYIHTYGWMVYICMCNTHLIRKYENKKNCSIYLYI